MARYRTINVDLNRQYRNDLNWNFQQIEDDIKAQEGITAETKTELLAELARIERESKERDDALADGNLEALLQSIETAKSNANTAAANADVKAAHAKTQGDYAKQQGDYAKNQGDYAVMKGDYADEKAIEADRAAGNANQEASNLSALKVAVTDATQSANTAAGKANTAATNSDGKAAYAQAQGDYAKLQGDRAKDVVETAPVVSVNGKKGVVTLTATDVGAETPAGAQEKANTAEANAKNASLSKSEKGVANGVARLNAAGKVVDVSGNEVAGKVTSVNGKVGDIVIPVFSGSYTDLTNKPTIPSTKSDIGLGNVDNVKQVSKTEFDTHKAVIASPTVLGHMKVGSNLTVRPDGTVDATGGTPPDASLTQKGIVQLNDTANSTSKTQAATPNAVKQVNDKLTTSNVAVGSGSIAGTYSIAIGADANSNVSSSVAIGRNANVTATFGTAVGYGGKAIGASVALGYNSDASGSTSTSIGASTQALNANQGVLGGTGNLRTNTWNVPGSFSVAGTKNFEIPHPHPDKKDTHVIRHGAVESPTAGDTLYRYAVEAKSAGETVELQLPDYFENLNKDVDVWVNGDGHFGRAFGRVEGDILYVTCELAGSYKVLVIGTRNDDHDSVQSWDIKGAEREIGESWTGETYVFEVDEIIVEDEYLEVVA